MNRKEKFIKKINVDLKMNEFNVAIISVKSLIEAMFNYKDTDF